MPREDLQIDIDNEAVKDFQSARKSKHASPTSKNEKNTSNTGDIKSTSKGDSVSKGTKSQTPTWGTGSSSLRQSISVRDMDPRFSDTIFKNRKQHEHKRDDCLATTGSEAKSKQGTASEAVDIGMEKGTGGFDASKDKAAIGK